VIANKRFALILLCEVMVGCGSKVAATVTIYINMFSRATICLSSYYCIVCPHTTLHVVWCGRKVAATVIIYIYIYMYVYIYICTYIYTHIYIYVFS
jgi:hypothetical protein